MSLHSHVLRTTTRELPDLLNEWATGELRPGDPAEEISPVYCGGRDWVVVIRHRDHGPGAVQHNDHEHGNERVDHRADPRYLDSIGCDDRTGTVAQIGPVLLAKASGTPMGDDGSALPPSESVLIEDEHRTWALWCRADGRPAVMWLRREAGSGAVIADPIRFGDTEIEEIPGWDLRMLRESRGEDQPNRAPVDLVRWLEAHADLIGEGSAVDNAVRLLDHAYGELPPDAVQYLSAKTPQITRTPAGQSVSYEWERAARSGDYDDFRLNRRVDLGEQGYTETVYSLPIYRHDYSPEDVARIVRDLAAVLTDPRAAYGAIPGKAE